MKNYATDAVPHKSTIDRELLDRNLEAKRQEGLCCPNCQQTMEWSLGPKTRGEILDAMAWRELHESFIQCDKDECPTFLRRIGASTEGTIDVNTLPLSAVLSELQLLRLQMRENLNDVGILVEICRLGNTTPDDLLAKSKAWAEKQQRG